MFKLTVRDLENKREFEAYGAPHEILEQAKTRFPGYNVTDVNELVDKLNKNPFYHAEYKQVIQYGSSVLPEDYLTHDQSEDPWPRAGDKD